LSSRTPPGRRLQAREALAQLAHGAGQVRVVRDVDDLDLIPFTSTPAGGAPQRRTAAVTIER
jgi:hypothetical protein